VASYVDVDLLIQWYMLIPNGA